MTNRVITIGFFLIISVAFAAEFALRPFLGRPNTENRRLVGITELQEAGFYEKFGTIDAAVKDYAPFRPELLRLNAFINYFGFSTIDNESVVLGKDNWLFLTSNYNYGDMADYQGTNLYTEEQLAEFSESVKALERMPFETVIYIAPNKSQVLREFVPSYYKKISAISKSRQISEYITNNTNIKLIYEPELFAQRSKTEQIYCKYDTHWNQKGAALAFSSIASALGINNTAELEFTKKAQNKFSDLANISVLYSILNDDFDYDINITSLQNKEQRKLLFCGDSFGYYLIGLNEAYFEQSEFAQLEHLSQKLLIEASPDILIIEIVERDIDKLNVILKELNEVQ